MDINSIGLVFFNFFVPVKSYIEKTRANQLRAPDYSGEYNMKKLISLLSLLFVLTSSSTVAEK